MVCRKSTIALLLAFAILLSAFIVLFHVEPVGATFSLQDQDNAIMSGLDWLDRFIYYEINSTDAMSLTTPFLQFRVKSPSGKFIISGKTTDTDGKPINWPDGGTRDNMLGGCETEMVTSRNNITSEQFSTIGVLWKWDLDGGGDTNGMLMYTELVGWNATYEKLFIQIDSMKSAFNNAGYELQLCNDTATSSSMAVITSDLSSGASFGPYVKENGYRTRQCFMRPTLKGLADLYYKLGVTINPSTGNTYAYDRGINYTNRAFKLYNTYYGAGYVLDRFDGMYNATLTTRPFPSINKGYGPDPDLIQEIENEVYPDYSGPYLDNSDKDKYWYTYANASGPSAGNVNRQEACSRAGMPDDISFYSSPFLCDDSSFVYSYRSRTGMAWARNQYIADGFEFDQYNQGRYPTPWIRVVEGLGSDCKMLRVCEDLYKYGNNIPYGNDKLKNMIKGVSWDDYGVSTDYFLTQTTGGIPIGFAYPCYATHITAPYLNACVKAYSAFGDSWFVQRADAIASVLLRLQVKNSTTLYSRNNEKDMYMPDWVGGFLAGYCIAYSFGNADILWESYEDVIYWWLRVAYQYTGGKIGFVFDNFPYMSFPSPESSIPAVWALIEYRKLGRTPASPSPPQFNLPVSEGRVYMDHGGSNGGDGTYELVSSDYNVSYLGGSTGNLRMYTGDVDRFRMDCEATSFQTAWANVTYWWTFSLSQLVTNLRAKVYFSVPNYLASTGMGGNNFHVSLELLNSNNVTMAGPQDLTILDGESGSGALMVCFDNVSVLNSLSAGNNYHVKLSFLISCGGAMWPMAAYMGLGHKYNTPSSTIKAMAVGLEWFGFDYDVPVTYIKGCVGQSTYVPSADKWSRNVSSLRVEFWFDDTDAQGDQVGGTSSYPTIATWPDGCVDLYDALYMNSHWNHDENSSSWDMTWYPNDIVADRVIDLYDALQISVNFGNSGLESGYYTNMTNIYVYFPEVGAHVLVDQYGYAVVPSGCTYFNVSNGFNGPVEGALVTYCYSMFS